MIEAHETHTRTADVNIDLTKISGIKDLIKNNGSQDFAKVSITQAVIYGWYDNEMGSYTNMLADRTVTIAEQMV